MWFLMNKPYVAQVELTRGCNMSCTFCAIDSVPKERKYMNTMIATKTAYELSVFDPIRIEFSLRGEPTLNPNWLQIVEIFRQYNPKSQITLATNGTKITPKEASIFYGIGGNILILDAYGKSKMKLTSRFKKFHPIDYYSGLFNPYHKHPASTKKLIIIDDLKRRDNEKQTRKILNQAGNVNYAKCGLEPLSEPLQNRCVHPFREINIFWNGDIPICCRDWKEETILWNVKKGHLKEYWEKNNVLNAYRYLLFHRNREYGICQRCDYNGGMRVGLIEQMAPFTKGKAEQAMKLIEVSINGN